MNEDFKCDACGKTAEQLNQMCHFPMKSDGSIQRWCDTCAEVGPDETPACPDEFLDVNGRCSFCG